MFIPFDSIESLECHLNLNEKGIKCPKLNYFHPLSLPVEAQFTFLDISDTKF